MGRRFKLTILFTHLSCLLNAQSITGVYVGKILTAKNALIITTVNNSISGSVYTSHYKNFQLVGTTSANKKINLILILENERQVLLTGKLDGDSLKLTSNDTIKGRRDFNLKKVSNNTDYNLNKVFGVLKSTNDPSLFGEWKTQKKIKLDASGHDDTGVKQEAGSFVFYSDGSFNYNSREVDEVKRKLKMKSMPRSRWNTHGSTLVLNYGPGFGAIPPIVIQHEFEVRNDTLIMTYDGRVRYYYIKVVLKKDR